MNAGGDKPGHPRYDRSLTVYTLDANIHINITISDAYKGARYLGLDIKVSTLERQ